MDRWVWVVGPALLLGACAHTVASTRGVSDEMLGNVPPEALAGVNERRTELDQAMEMVGRKHTDVDVDLQNLDQAQSELTVADGDLQQARQGEAKGAGEPPTLGRQALAHDRIDELTAKRRVAETRVGASEAQLRLAQQEEALAKARVTQAKAKLEWEKYLALQHAGDPAVQRIPVDGMQQDLTTSETQVRQEDVRRQALLDDASQAEQERRAATEAYDRTRGIGGSGQ